MAEISVTVDREKKREKEREGMKKGRKRNKINNIRSVYTFEYLIS